MPHKPSSVLKILLIFPFLITLLPACGPAPTPLPTETPTPTSTQTPPQPTVELPTQTPYVITATDEMIVTTPMPEGILFISLLEGAFSHLFAYSPQGVQLTRLTSNAWDDITPALSPDGDKLAFSSRRNGFWDLYLLDLGDGNLTRLTDSLEYDAAPSWSPDGEYIAYESYIKGNLDILIRSVTNPEQAPLQLTQDPAIDSSPAWSPLPGRQIAFISNRSGEPEVWIADLNQAGKFFNVSNNPNTVESHPAWSPDGTRLAWASADPTTGLTGIFFWDSGRPNSPASWLGSGDWPIWQSDTELISRLLTPNSTYITGNTISGEISLPPVLFSGHINGISYGITSAGLPGPFTGSAQVTPTAWFERDSDSQSQISPEQAVLVDLPEVTALYPHLIEQANNSFSALRSRVAALTGWDALGNLENAFVPLTTPLDPGMGGDWLHTGRAFTLNPVLVQANWMAVVREDFGQQVYWRIFLHTAAQDGSQGMPLTQLPWDFSARKTSSTAYENGGQLMISIPSGYWLDLTALAAQFGWERLPALTNWQTYYTGARFNELVFSEGLDWRSAMLQLYPPEILTTPTYVIPPTRTPTRTPLWFRSPTPTRTSTLHPTYTP